MKRLREARALLGLVGVGCLQHHAGEALAAGLDRVDDRRGAVALGQALDAGEPGQQLAREGGAAPVGGLAEVAERGGLEGLIDDEARVRLRAHEADQARFGGEVVELGGELLLEAGAAIADEAGAVQAGGGGVLVHGAGAEKRRKGSGRPSGTRFTTGRDRRQLGQGRDDKPAGRCWRARCAARCTATRPPWHSALRRSPRRVWVSGRPGGPVSRPQPGQRRRALQVWRWRGRWRPAWRSPA